MCERPVTLFERKASEISACSLWLWFGSVVMWFKGASGEVAVQCPHCSARDWRTPDELKGGRMFCFFCAHFSAWPHAAACADEQARG